MTTKDDSDNPEKRPATRKIVRSASTRREGADAPAGGDAPAEARSEEGTNAPAAGGSPAPGASGEGAPARPAPRTFNLNAGRPRGATPGPRRPPPRYSGDVSEARPTEGMRPRPGPNAARSAMGPRPSRPQRPEGEARPEGDRPPRAARPEGGDRPPRRDRPAGGPQGQRTGGPEGRTFAPREDRPRGPRPEGRGPRPEGRGPRPDARAEAPAQKPEVKAAAPAPKPAAPPPAPAKPEPPKKSSIVLIAPPPKATGGKSAAPKPALTAKEALAAKAKAAQNKGGKPAPARPQEATEATQAAPVETPQFDSADLSVGWDGAVAAARKAGDHGSALVDAWLAGSNAEAIAALADADDAPGPARKAARRAINILKARGASIPTRPRVARVDTRSEVALEATYLPPDGSGTTALSITSRDASGRYHLAEVIVREPIGILNAGSAWLSGSQLKEGRNRALEGLGVAPAPVPVEWARWKIAAARKLNATSGQILPLGLEGCRELIEPVPEAEPPHPLADLEAEVTSEMASARAPGSASLHEEPEFRGWLPDRGSLEELLQKLGQRLGPEGVRDPEQVNAALKEEIESATDRFFSPEARNVVATRMREAAISVRGRKGSERAREVLAVARAVREAGLITSPPREIPFLVGFFQKGISMLAHQGGGSLRIPVAPLGTPAPAPASTPETDEGSAEANPG
ncbi:hypothetical protein [Polyangium aurulentum]|uniref:hypothetical protein n=1 Tax=Polyangium aurulentum TaxID=2567896 RepID=UPI0010ADC41C|nr:hypothetical protein [Polyangium aurulentum]UQA60796.1 hypothetical protein E8A73_010070 [Polyangium aurulentum]